MANPIRRFEAKFRPFVLLRLRRRAIYSYPSLLPQSESEYARKPPSSGRLTDRSPCVGAVSLSGAGWVIGRGDLDLAGVDVANRDREPGRTHGIAEPRPQ